MPFYLQNSEPIAPGLRRIAEEQIIIGLKDSDENTKSTDRGVHSLRIRCKKLRGLLRLTRPLMEDVFILEDQHIREAAKRLAENRDREVIAKTIASFGGSICESDTAHHPVSQQDIEQSRRILSNCLASINDWPLNLHGFYDIAPGFGRTYRKCQESWQRVLALQSDHNFHRLRRWGKYHWYHIRILERLNKPVLSKRRKRLRKLQLSLGDAHDLAMLQAFLGTQENLDERLLEQVRERKKELYAKAIKTGGKIFKIPVDELVADFSRYWAKQYGSNSYRG